MIDGLRQESGPRAPRSPQAAWIAPEPRSVPGLERGLSDRFPYYEVNFGRWLPADLDAPILDYGCGAGGFLRYLETRGYRNVTGFDVDARYADFCRSHTRARIEQGEEGREFLRAHADRYEAIFSLGVAYYFPRPQLPDWFDALAGALRPGGQLMIEVNNGAGLSGFWSWVNDPYIQTVYSEFSLRYLVQGAGLRVVSLESERHEGRGVRRALWLAGRRVLAMVRQASYLLERGLCVHHPKLFGKYLIMVAERQ